jgi:hypothetical protein
MFKPIKSSLKTKWRLLAKLPTVELCGILKTGTTLPIAVNFLNHLKSMFPTMPTTCGVSIPYHFEVYNVTIFDACHDGLLFKGTLNVPIPNGIYKSILKLSNFADPAGVRLEWDSEIDIGFNNNSFKSAPSIFKFGL